MYFFAVHHFSAFSSKIVLVRSILKLVLCNPIGVRFQHQGIIIKHITWWLASSNDLLGVQ